PPLGLCELVPPDAALGVVLPPQVAAQLDALVPRAQGDQRIAVVVKGPRGSGRRAAAHRIARTLGRPLLVVPIPELVTAESKTRTSLLGTALAAARLRDAVPYLADADALYDESGTMAA